MTRDEFDEYCSGLKSVTHVVQWGGESVWKIGGKIFATHSGDACDDPHSLSFKCSDHNYLVLCELPNIVPAPYMARAKWVQLNSKNAMSNDDIKDYLGEAYKIISGNLTKKLQKELGLMD